MYIIQWVGQTCFGPFDSLEKAISWTEKKFESTWANLTDFRCHYVESPDHKVIAEHREVGGYLIAGGEFLAIAINSKNPSDAHWFTKNSPYKEDPSAFKRAVKWASPGVAAGGRPRPAGTVSEGF